MTLEEIAKKIVKMNPDAIMAVEVKDDDTITSHIWGRMDKEAFYSVLEDAVAQHKEELLDEIKDQLPF